MWEWIFSFSSCSLISGMLFFHSLPVPEFWECFFSFPFRYQIVEMDFFIPFPFLNFGMGFFHSLPVPELWEWVFFSFPSRSWILGMVFFISFSFPNFGIGIIYSRSRSRTPKSHSCSPLQPLSLFFGEKILSLRFGMDWDLFLFQTLLHFGEESLKHFFVSNRECVLRENQFCWSSIQVSRRRCKELAAPKNIFSAIRSTPLIPSLRRFIHQY